MLISLPMLAILTGILAFYFIQPVGHVSLNRKAYEHFLIKKMRSLPNLKQKYGAKAADKPDMAGITDFFMTLDPALGYVPSERRILAYQSTRNQCDALSGSTMAWESVPSDMGGRSRCAQWDLNDPNHKKAWAGSVTGGLWFNNDVTSVFSAWQPVDDFWQSLAVSSIAYDPTNTQVMYVGTGEAETALTIYRESSGRGIGLMKSIDGGTSWAQIPSTSGWAYVTDVLVRNENGMGVVYAGVSSGLYMGQQQLSQPTDGLYRSADGGNSWQQVLPDIDGFNIPYSVADIEVSSAGKLFVGSKQNVDLEGGGVIFSSEDGTSGSWEVYADYVDIIKADPVYNIPGRVMLATAPSDANVVYAQYSVGYSPDFVRYKGRYILKTTNAGGTWNAVNIPNADWSTLSWHAFNLAVHPGDANAVFTGGLDLYKTMNGGLFWEHISDWALMYYGGGENYVHADQHATEFNPANPQQALFTSDGGVFFSANAGNSYPTFSQQSQGFNTLQFYTCAMHPQAGKAEYLGGLQDNGTLYYKGAPLNIDNMIDGGDGAYCFWDQNEPQIFITSVYYNAYSAYLNGNSVGGIYENTGTFISPAAYDYNLNTIYSNAVGFFGENANQILRVSGIPSTMNTQYLDLGTASDVPFSSITYSENSPTGTSTLFIGTQAGRLFKVTNAQAQPQVVEITGNNFPTANLACTSIGKSDDTLLVIFSNYGVESIFQSYNGGTTWDSKEGNLPDMPIRWAIYHPQNTKQALIATETGIWQTYNLHETVPEWQPAIGGMANVRVDMLQIRKADNKVLAATHGRGLFTADYPVDFAYGLKPSGLSSFHAFCASNGTIVLQGIQGHQVNLQILTLDGKQLLNTRIKPNNGKASFSIDYHGVVLIKVQDKHASVCTKLIL